MELSKHNSPNRFTNRSIDRRLSPRFNVQLEVLIILEDGTALPAQTLNLSANGVKILCDSWVTDEIEPRGIQNHAACHTNLKVIIALGACDRKLVTRCRIRSAQRLSQLQFCLNMAFRSLEQDSQRHLDAYLQQLLYSDTLQTTSSIR